jgi:hypothetical protein
MQIVKERKYPLHESLAMMSCILVGLKGTLMILFPRVRSELTDCSPSPGVIQSLPTFYEWTKNYLRTPAQGADTIAWLILNPPQERNYWFDRAPAPEHKWYAQTSASAQEEAKLLSKVRQAGGLDE